MSDKQNKTVITFDPPEKAVDVQVCDDVLDLDTLRERRRSTPPGEHLWVVSLLYRIEDPETALDDMTLGAHNLVGAQPIVCLWCVQGYKTPNVPGPVCTP